MFLYGKVCKNFNKLNFFNGIFVHSNRRFWSAKKYTILTPPNKKDHVELRPSDKIDIKTISSYMIVTRK